MIDLDGWLERYVSLLKETFGERVWFAGLQGSYGRGDADEGSDIDMVLILETLCAEDIGTYRDMLDRLEHREMVCGFLAGRREVQNWESSDLFQFCHDTTPLVGSLDSILEKVDAEAVDRAIRTGACNLYHGCVHNMLFEQDAGILRELTKAATFVIRARVFREQGCFCRGLQELSRHAGPGDREIVEAYRQLKHEGIWDFSGGSARLFSWVQGILQTPEASV